VAEGPVLELLPLILRFRLIEADAKRAEKREQALYEQIGHLKQEAKRSAILSWVFGLIGVAGTAWGFYAYFNPGPSSSPAPTAVQSAPAKQENAPSGMQKAN
jgi:hypothetical protein